MTDPEYVDTAGAAEMLRVNRATIWRYVTAGRLTPDAKFGRSPVFRPATIRRYIEGLSPAAYAAYARRGRGSTSSA